MSSAVKPPASGPSADATTVSFPGAERPARTRSVDSHGVRIAVYEWGDADAPPLLLVHGGFDFAGTFDVFAPILARAGHRVVSWDHRGHGDSEHTALYSWDADVRDLLTVLDSITQEPLPVIGHSKGGGLVTQLIQALPHRFTRFVNIDGVPTPRRHPDVADRERTRMLAKELSGWLDHRREGPSRVRKAGTLDELAERRRRMNPRLPLEWLRYLVPIGARRDEDGWRWKLDPVMRFGGFGPWRPEWGLARLPGLSVPMLGVIGLEEEPMGWGGRAEDIEPWAPRGSELQFLEGVGHFAHIEEPERVARLSLDFLS
ncbi:MAG: alpha/beta hydrolase [Myxococcota bacterium]|nr:alpha/beta hydrolase [Myxococcota bacterium]